GSRLHSGSIRHARGQHISQCRALATTLTTNSTTFLRASRGCGKGNGRGELRRVSLNGAAGKLWFFLVVFSLLCRRAPAPRHAMLARRAQDSALRFACDQFGRMGPGGSCLLRPSNRLRYTYLPEVSFPALPCLRFSAMRGTFMPSRLLSALLVSIAFLPAL